MLRAFISALGVLIVTGCAGLGGGSSNQIEGNNTGGVIPPALAQGADVQRLADEHCAQYQSTARITFNQAERGGEVVFVCVGPGGAPIWMQPAAAEPEGENTQPR